MSEFRTKPNPDQPGRCPSIDPHDSLQCARSLHEDDQCVYGGIAWNKGTPRYVSPQERHIRDLEGAVDRVRRLHSQPDSILEPGKWCPGCGHEDPCPTIRALATPAAPGTQTEEGQ